MSDLTIIRAAVRVDLHDEDSSAYRWADATLDRHIKRALLEYSQAAPLEQKSVLTTTAGSREISVSTLTPRVRIVAAEYPAGEYPPSFAPFSLWGDTLTLDITGAPGGVENVNVFWHKTHSITTSSATFPASHDDIIAGGAAAYAALEWASFATNRLNVAGDEVWGRYMEFGNVRLAAFKDALRRLPEQDRPRSSRLYTPVDVRLRSQTTDPGPL